MSKFTNYLIAAAIVVALVGCKKDGGSSAGLPTSYSTNNGTLRVTVNDWDLESYKDAQVTVSETGEGLTIGIYNALTCYPEVLVSGCNCENGIYSGEKVLLEGLRNISIKATVDSSKMLLNIYDNHTGPYIGKEWMIGGTGKVETVYSELCHYTSTWGWDSGQMTIDSSLTLYAYDTITCEMPAIYISSTMNYKVPNFGYSYNAQYRLKDTSAAGRKAAQVGSSYQIVPKDSIEFGKLCEYLQAQIRLRSFFGTKYLQGANKYPTDTQKFKSVDNSGYWNPTLEQYRHSDKKKLPHFIAKTDTTEKLSPIWAVLANFEYFELSKFGRAGVIATDYEHTRAKEFLRWCSAEGTGTTVKKLHDLVYNATNPLNEQPLLSMVDPYSKYNILQFGEAKSQYSDAILLEICTGKLGDRVIELVNSVLKDIFYSSKKIEFDHLDIPLQLISYSESGDKMTIGFDQTFIKGIVEQLYNEVKDMDWNQFKTEVLPGWETLEVTQEDFQEAKDYITSAYNYLVAKGCEINLSIDLVPYDPTKLMPWEKYMADRMKAKHERYIK